MERFPSTYVEGFHDKDAVLKMKYNNLGNTGLMVSHISIGGGAFSNFYDEFDEEEAIKTIREGIKKGINYIDTAPWYGQGRSETILGKALMEVPRKAYYIATKVGRYEVDYANMFNFTAEKTENSLLNSLKLLKLDYVDILQIHDVEFAPNTDMILNETLPAVSSLKKQGYAKFIGITGYPLSILRDIAEKSTITIDIILSYCRNTLIDTALNDYTEFFRSKGIGIVCASGHGMGLFTNRGPQNWHPASDKIKKICRQCSDYCNEKGIELGRIAIWYSIKNKNADTHLIGMNNSELLDSNLSVLQNGITEDEEKAFKYIMETYLSQLCNQNWEGVELEKYWKRMKNMVP